MRSPTEIFQANHTPPEIGKPETVAKDGADDEDEQFEEEGFDLQSCEIGCCDKDCECDDCIRCANNNLNPDDDYSIVPGSAA